MSEEFVTKKTKWECIKCGDCCKGIIISKNQNLSIIKDNKPICKFLDNNICINYLNRPFICKLYPFIIDIDKIMSHDGIARPQNAFKLENLKIHTECPGVGQGKRIYANANLIRKMERLSMDFSLRFKDVADGNLSMDELF